MSRQWTARRARDTSRDCREGNPYGRAGEGEQAVAGEQPYDEAHEEQPEGLGQEVAAVGQAAQEDEGYGERQQGHELDDEEPREDREPGRPARGPDDLAPGPAGALGPGPLCGEHQARHSQVVRQRGGQGPLDGPGGHAAPVLEHQGHGVVVDGEALVGEAHVEHEAARRWRRAGGRGWVLPGRDRVSSTKVTPASPAYDVWTSASS